MTSKSRGPYRQERIQCDLTLRQHSLKEDEKLETKEEVTTKQREDKGREEGEGFGEGGRVKGTTPRKRITGVGTRSRKNRTWREGSVTERDSGYDW